MREYLGISVAGPIGNLIQLLENRGILVYACDIENDAFSGMNGLVNERPYIVFNKNMSPERLDLQLHMKWHTLFFNGQMKWKIKKLKKWQLLLVVHFFFQKQMQKESLSQKN